MQIHGDLQAKLVDCTDNHMASEMEGISLLLPFSIADDDVKRCRGGSVIGMS